MCICIWSARVVFWGSLPFVRCVVELHVWKTETETESQKRVPPPFETACPRGFREKGTNKLGSRYTTTCVGIVVTRCIGSSPGSALIGTAHNPLSRCNADRRSSNDREGLQIFSKQQACACMLSWWTWVLTLDNSGCSCAAGTAAVVAAAAL